MDPSRPLRRVWSGLPTIVLLVATLAGGLAARAFTPSTGLASSPGIADDLLLSGVFATIPADATWIGIERVTLAPGAVRAIGKVENEGAGPWLYRVERGALTVVADGPMAVRRDGAQTNGVVGPGTAVSLGPGDRGSTPTGVGTIWRNATNQPVTALDVEITNATGLPDLDGTSVGVRNDLLAAECTSYPLPIPPGPAAIGLRRVTMAPGATLPAARIAGLIALAVDAGVLTVDDPGGTAGSTPGSFPIRSGNGRVFGGAGYRVVPPGWVFRNATSEPVQALLLTLTPADPLATTRG